MYVFMRFLQSYYQQSQQTNKLLHTFMKKNIFFNSYIMYLHSRIVAAAIRYTFFFIHIFFSSYILCIFKMVSVDQFNVPYVT